MSDHIVGVIYASINRILFLFKLVPIGLDGKQPLASPVHFIGTQAPNVLSVAPDMKCKCTPVFIT